MLFSDLCVFCSHPSYTPGDTSIQAGPDSVPGMTRYTLVQALILHLNVFKFGNFEKVKLF